MLQVRLHPPCLSDNIYTCWHFLEQGVASVDESVSINRAGENEKKNERGKYILISL